MIPSTQARFQLTAAKFETAHYAWGGRGVFGLGSFESNDPACGADNSDGDQRGYETVFDRVTPDSLLAARSVLERYLDIWALHVEKVLQNQEPGRRAAGEVSILKQALRWRIIPNAAL